SVVRREDFDASLVAQVRARGVEVREGVALRGFRVEADGVAVETSDGLVHAKILACASGAGSLVRKALRAGGPVERCPKGGAAQRGPLTDRVPIRLFRGEIPAPPSWRGRTGMVYDFSLMADGVRGYLWLFPVPGDRLNVGLMHSPSRK